MLRIGPAGWNYKDWNGVVYPQPRPRGFSELAFLARYFGAVEINTSFYRPITSKMAQSWVRQIECQAEFRFTAKLWRGFTHNRDASTEDESLVKDGLLPLLEAKRLGALLLQFPWSFRNDEENRAYLLKLRDRFRDLPLVLEVRHASWSEPTILALLEELEIALCNIDQPLYSRSIKPASAVTARIGYVRLHGRNYKSWFTESKYHGERYDYLYSPEELDPWADRIRAVHQAAQETYVVTNNHYLGKAVANALELTSILEGRAVEPPSQLLATYPQLQDFMSSASKPEPGEQLTFLLE